MQHKKVIGTHILFDHPSQLKCFYNMFFFKHLNEDNIILIK